ncbi:hypothetical protein MTO96_009237 [Rhipicephalus appendiculatus]
MAAATPGLQLARVLWTTGRSLASSSSTTHCHATAITCMRASMGWRRHAVACYSSNTINGAVRLSYSLHKSRDEATASALPPIVASDGLFGRKENLAKVCKALASATGRNVFAVDMRNQGDSPHTEDMNYALTTADLELFLQDRGVSKAAFVGHSFAGRVAMKFAVTKPSAVERLVVVDIAVNSLPPAVVTEWLPRQMNAMEHILSLLSPDMSLEQALQVADQYLSTQVTKPYVRSVLLANLCKRPHSYEWQFNLKAFRRNLQPLADLHYLDNKSSNVDALFVAADESAYLTTADLPDIKQDVSQRAPRYRERRQSQGTH